MRPASLWYLYTSTRTVGKEEEEEIGIRKVYIFSYCLFLYLPLPECCSSLACAELSFPNLVSLHIAHMYLYK